MSPVRGRGHGVIDVFGSGKNEACAPIRPLNVSTVDIMINESWKKAFSHAGKACQNPVHILLMLFALKAPRRLRHIPNGVLSHIEVQLLPVVAYIRHQSHIISSTTITPQNDIFVYAKVDNDIIIKSSWACYKQEYIME